MGTIPSSGELWPALLVACAPCHDLKRSCVGFERLIISISHIGFTHGGLFRLFGNSSKLIAGNMDLVLLLSVVKDFLPKYLFKIERPNKATQDHPPPARMRFLSIDVTQKILHAEAQILVSRAHSRDDSVFIICHPTATRTAIFFTEPSILMENGVPFMYNYQIGSEDRSFSGQASTAQFISWFGFLTFVGEIFRQTSLSYIMARIWGPIRGYNNYCYNLIFRLLYYYIMIKILLVMISVRCWKRIRLPELHSVLSQTMR